MAVTTNDSVESKSFLSSDASASKNISQQCWQNSEGEIRQDKPVPGVAQFPELELVECDKLAARFSQVAAGLFERLDPGFSGFISKEAVAKALVDPNYKGEQQQCIAAMFGSFDAIRDLNNDGIIDNSRGITRADLAQFIRTADSYKLESTSLAAQLKYFAASDDFTSYDKNHDGQLDRDELNQALRNTNDLPLGCPERGAVGFVNNSSAILSNQHQDGFFSDKPGVSCEDIKQFADNILHSPKIDLVESVGSTMREVKSEQDAHVSSDVFANNKNPLESIKADAIKQGTIGDCHFEAPLAALAQQAPQQILDMIKPIAYKPGWYRVTFRGDKNNPVDVKSPTIAEMGLYNHGSTRGTWASLIEKAYGKYESRPFSTAKRALSELSALKAPILNPLLPQEAARYGDQPSHSVELLTGGVNEHSPAKDGVDTTANLLQQALGANKVVTCSYLRSNLEKLLNLNNPTSQDISNSHQYSVVGFNGTRNTVTIRNPHGDDGPNKDGYQVVSLRQFCNYFNNLEIGR